MGFQLVHIHIQPGLVGLYQGQDDLGGDNPAEPHAHQGEDVHVDPGGHGGDPQPQGDKMQEQDDQGQDGHQKYGTSQYGNHFFSSFRTTVRPPVTATTRTAVPVS